MRKDFASTRVAPAMGLLIAATASCAAGPTEETLASSQGTPTNIVVDATSVYWLDDSLVMKAGLDGGNPTTFVYGAAPSALAVDATNLYWIDVSVDSVLKTDLGGGPPITLATGQHALQIAVNTTGLYWVNKDCTVMKIGLDGGTPKTLHALPHSKDGCGDQLNPPLVADATSVYWIIDSSTVMKAPTGGGAAKELLNGPSNMADLAVDATSVYFTHQRGSGPEDTAAVMKASK